MGRNCKNWLIWAGLMLPYLAVAQQPCTMGIRIDGTITDPTGAVIPGAEVQTADGEKTISDAAGYFLLPCVRISSNKIMAQAEGFTPKAATIEKQAGGSVHLNLQLEIAHVETIVQVDGDASSSDRGSGTATLSTKDVQLLADDPDDFLRQLQALSASGGGSPASTLILVDGFQNGSAIPPKSSIATIRVNPDLFSAEYQTPPFSSGVIEIVTKPGADSFHGALFYSDSDSSFNATDPFSATATPAGKRRYGFELSGPVLPKKSGFALALEKRDIDEFNIVNAVTLDGSGNQVPLRQAISAPQRLWIASARGDWQVSSKDVAVFSFSSNVNNLGNQGVGGLTLAEAGYSSLLSENDLRFTNTLIPNANLLHATHIGYSWKRTEQSPLSTSPALQVSGYFIGGGSSGQNLNDRERDLEIDDDLLITHGKHQLKFGVQSLGIFEHDYNPNNFNGTYVFGGGSAPVLDANNSPTGQTTTISAIEQYRRAQNNLPGGIPTTYQVTGGTPLVPLTQWRLGLYLQDIIKLGPRFTVNAGLRYAFQTSPDSVGNFGPRASFSWSPDKKETWIFRARIGLFSGSISPHHALEVARLNDVLQKQVTVYSPSYVDPLVQVPGSIEVGTTQQFPHSLAQPLEFAGYFNAEHELPHHWSVRVNFYLGETWNVVRIRNINAPMVKSGVDTAPNPTAALLAPRPIASNENLLQYQNSGHFAGNVLSFVVDQHSYKRFGLFAYYAYRNSRTDGGSGDGIPQSSYSDIGESARADWASTHGFFLNGNLNLPYRLVLSTEFAAQQGTPYNIITGTDNNGDGNFNNRPAYASAPGAGVYSTRFGLLTANAVNGDVPRNLGTMPSLIHLDANMSRIFNLKTNDRSQTRTLTFNVRSANLLNHTNVTAVQTVLSPNLGQPLSGEAGRRLELGARFAF
ncbi:TonB-dependent receptor [Granulicella sp. WH15]|nr:TonB-dependent receptor [Granulicella sp. WH15]